MLRGGFCIFLGVLCFLSGPAYGQVYHIYRPLPASYPQKQIAEHKPSWAEVGAAPFISFGKIKDAEGKNVASAMAGIQIRGSLWVSERLTVGLEGNTSQAVKQRSSLISSLKSYALSGFVKWVLTPDMNPQLYGIMMAGAVQRDGRFWYSLHNFKQRSLMGGAGVGTAWEISSRWFLNAECRQVYESAAWDTFVFTAPKWRTEFAAGISYRF